MNEEIYLNWNCSAEDMRECDLEGDINYSNDEDNAVWGIKFKKRAERSKK